MGKENMGMGGSVWGHSKKEGGDKGTRRQLALPKLCEDRAVQG